MGSTTRLSKRGTNPDRLNDRETRFIAEYLVDYNGARAAKAAGYSEKTAAVQAAKLLAKPKIQAVIGKERKETLERLEIKREEVLLQLWYAVTRTSDDFIDDNGKLITDLSQLSDRAKACVDGIEQEVTTFTSEDGETRETVKTKLKITPKLGALDLAMKHKGLFEPEKKEHTHKIDWDSLYQKPTKPDEIDLKLIEVEGERNEV